MAVLNYWSVWCVRVGPPEFSSVPQNTSVVTGESVQLTCGGSGDPLPALTWWRLEEEGGGAREVVTDGQHYITRDFLLLTRVSLLAEGLYYCNLSSPAGTELSQPVFLDVLSK